MSRKSNRVPYRLDAGDVVTLSADEIAAILRGADNLIATGGRALLTKILKGSRDKKLLALELDRSPVYGYYRHLTLAQIQARVDWVILNGYLAIEYDWRLPVLVYTDAGWAIERETVARELLRDFDERLATGQTTFDMSYLKDRARDMIMLLLDLVEESGNPRYIPLLEAWAAVDYKKVRRRIATVIDAIRTAPPADEGGR